MEKQLTIFDVNHPLNRRLQLAKEGGLYFGTPRLVMMPMCKEDAPRVFQWTSDGEVTRYMRYDTYTDVSQAEEWLTSPQQQRDNFGIFLKDGELIGCISCHLDIVDKKYKEIGYTLNRHFWGNGYCTEATFATIAYFAEKGTCRFLARHDVRNTPSQRVIEKCGFNYVSGGNQQSYDGKRTFLCREYLLDVTLHRMDLHDAPFRAIQSGEKTVEMRLYDEKRQQVKEGNYICFQNRSSGKKIVTVVEKLHIFPSFEQLYANMDLLKCGYTADTVPTASPKDMDVYYSPEKQQNYSVVGIELRLVAVL